MSEASETSGGEAPSPVIVLIEDEPQIRRFLRATLGSQGYRLHEATTGEDGLIEAASNGQTKNLVAEGMCDFGWTDTDDFYVALDAGQPVAQVPVRLDDGSTISIPNSVAILRGTKRLEQAQQPGHADLAREQ